MTTKKTNFENLEIYILAEQLADRVWEIVLKWNYLAQDTVGKQLIRSAAASAQILPREAEGEASRTIAGSFGLPVALSMKPATGFGEHSGGNYLPKVRLRA